MPKDPIQRAKARFFIENVGAKVTPAWMAFAKLKERRAMPADQRWAQLAPVQLQPADTAKPVSVPVREKRATSAARETGRNARPPRGPAWSRPARRLTGRAARKPVAESADKPQPT